MGRFAGLRMLAALLPALAFIAALAACRPRDSVRLVVPELVRTHLYVAPNGDDSDPGTRKEPFRTLARAAQVATAGTTVHVAPGFYSGGVRTTAHGTAEARIVFQSSERWGARVVPPLAARQGAAWDNRGNYVDIVDFEIDGAQYQSGMRWQTGIYAGGAHGRVHGNRVRHIATDGPCDERGGGGIVADSQYKGFDAVISGNIVHDIGAPGCRDMHGIGVGARARIEGNVVYRVAGAAIHLWHDASHVVVQANTVVASGIGILVGAGDFYHGAGPNDYTRVERNIVYDNDLGILEHGATGPANSFSDNLVHANAAGDWRLAEGRRHTGTIDAPPQFAAYTLEDSPDDVPDFRLRPGSPALAPPPRAGTGPPGATTALREATIGALPAVPAPPAA